jgi:hypothetical protein
MRIAALVLIFSLVSMPISEAQFAIFQTCSNCVTPDDVLTGSNSSDLLQDSGAGFVTAN